MNIQAVDISRTALDTIGTAERIAEAYGDDRDFANEMIGQAKAHDAYKKLSQTAWAENLKKAKENKIYTAFKGRIGTNGLAMKGTWEEYCQMLGVSDEKANQDIANLNAFGTEALEAMTNAGIGYRDLRQFPYIGSSTRLAMTRTTPAFYATVADWAGANKRAGSSNGAGFGDFLPDCGRTFYATRRVKRASA